MQSVTKQNKKIYKTVINNSNNNSNFFYFLCLFSDHCCSVRIQKITVPSVVVMDYDKANNKKPLNEFFLDCEYDVDDNENGLVIKWLLNGNLVYQWIPPRAPTALSIFKNRIKKDFTVTDDPLKKYRGIAVTKPLLNFTGEYSCSVQTFQSSDKKSSHLQIVGKFRKPLKTTLWSVNNANKKFSKTSKITTKLKLVQFIELSSASIVHFP